jgi:bifunctional UDP-N-acetylglucosamine pyrophosphorylase/glucosamine-1-phosphate N-acetyltransferase
MKLSDLFSAEMEAALMEWLSKFTSLEELLAARHQLFAKLSSQTIQGTIEDGASIIGPVHIGMGAVVRTQTIIRGPAIVGTDSVVESHTEIQPGCFIGSNCIVGHGCCVRESMLMNNVVVWPSAVIIDSILGFGSVVGPGAVLGAKLQLSWTLPRRPSEFGAALGDHAVVGANCTLKPGTILRPGVTIGDATLAEGLHETTGNRHSGGSEEFES